MSTSTDDDVDGLLESLTMEEDDDYREEQATIPLDAEREAKAATPPARPAKVAAPVPPAPVAAPPTERLRVPRPPAARIPRPGQDATGQPPAVNPAGPPRREPFLPATSPVAPPVRPPKPSPKGLPVGFDDSDIDAVLSPLSQAPPTEPAPSTRAPRSTSIPPRPKGTWPMGATPPPPRPFSPIPPPPRPTPPAPPRSTSSAPPRPPSSAPPRPPSSAPPRPNAAWSSVPPHPTPLAPVPPDGDVMGRLPMDARADSWNPPTLDPERSLDELEAVEMPQALEMPPTPGEGDALWSRETAAPPPGSSGRRPGPSDTIADAGDVSVQAVETSFEEWDDESETSIRVSSHDLEPEAEAGYASLSDLGIDEELEDELPAHETPAAPGPRSAQDSAAAFDDADVQSVVSAILIADASGARTEEHRLRAELKDAWIARAEWFEAEAQAHEDAAARARLLLAASELWAMSGNTVKARHAADRASQYSPSLGLAGRQTRALAALEGDWKAVAAALDVEARSAASEAARSHAAYLAAEVHRVILRDPQQAERRLDQLVRSAPEDPRPYLARIARDLGTAPAAPRTRVPDAEVLAPLRAALDELGRLRSGQPSEGPRSPAAAFEDARRALASGDREEAGKAVRELSAVPGIGDGALFLAAALLAPAKETRGVAIEALRELLPRWSNPTVRRALAARALEQGDPEAMARALGEHRDGRDGADREEAGFGIADRIALGTLAGDSGGMVREALSSLENDAGLLPLAAAATAGSGEEAILVGEPLTRAELTLGRRLTATPPSDALGDSVHAIRAAAPDAPLGRVLSLELDSARGAASAVATELVRLAPADHAPEGKLAAALVEELADHPDVARRHYTAALSSPGAAEPAARALLEPGDPAAAQLLATIADALGEGGSPRQALLLFEAAVRRNDHETRNPPGGAEDARASIPGLLDDLLTRAHEACTDLPFAARLGADVARARGDVGALLGWLKRQRDAARDPVARALDAVREALLVADEDPANAVSRLDEALAARPDDIALRELAERLNPAPSLERGYWRERAADRAPLARTRALLLYEAAAEYEQQGAREDAIRAANAAVAAGSSDLARIAAERLSPDAAALPKEGLAALRAREHAALGAPPESSADSNELYAALAALPDRAEAQAHARLGARLKTRTEPWEASRDLVELAAKTAPRSLWVLRQASAHARVAGDDERLLEVEQELAERVGRPLDRATLLLRAAEAAARLGSDEEALGLVGRVIAAVPDHVVARDLRARVAERMGNAGLAAEDLEVIANTTRVTEHQFSAWYRAAVLWSDTASAGGPMRDPERALAALEHAAAIDVTRGDVFERLQALFVAKGDRAKLAALLEARLARTDSPEERVALEVTRGRALTDIGDHEAARRALGAALEASPDHTDALEAYAGLCAADGDFKSAEEAWIRLARVATDPEKQADIYGKLAELYEDKVPNPQRAEICYREILKRRPNDPRAMTSLVRVYSRIGDPIKAIQIQTALIERAATPEEKRDRTLGLSVVYDEAGKDKKSALAILEKARKAWPHDAAVLRAVAAHHQRHGETAALNVLLDRAASEARRALSHGRFELAFFAVLEAAAALRGQTDASQLSGATLAALEGKSEIAVRGAGAAATDPGLDEFVAPELLTPALRTLMRKLPGVLDKAYPVDLKSLRAGPVPPEAAELAGEIRAVAESMGVRSLELYVSPALGAVFLPVSGTPARLVIGEPLLRQSDDTLRYFLLVRAIRMMTGEVAAFTRIAPVEQWPALAALLEALAKGFQPAGIDAARLADARRRIGSALPTPLPDANELSTLALEVSGAIGNRASQLGQAVGQWASRTALLAVGLPSIALRGVALALGQPDMPADPEGRMKWILRHPEARDVAVFAVSEGCAEARRRLGLG